MCAQLALFAPSNAAARASAEAIRDELQKSMRAHSAATTQEIKAALESATRYLANDLGPQQIRVNAISPGPMKTLAGAAIGGARATFRHTEANAPMRSNASLEAIGGTAVWLCSDYGNCTTGEVVHVDCGFHVLGMPQAGNL